MADAEDRESLTRLSAGAALTFEDALEKLLGVEGGFSDDPADRGGATRFGVTEAVARANGYRGAMRDLPVAEAKRIARVEYWDRLQLDAVAGVDGRLAHELLDTGYNMGTGTAAKFLQRSLNALNREQRDYPDLKVDGDVGPVTVGRVRSFVAKRGAGGMLVLLRALNCLQGARYVELAEADRSQEAFVFGWLANRVAP